MLEFCFLVVEKYVLTIDAGKMEEHPSTPERRKTQLLRNLETLSKMCWLKKKIKIEITNSPENYEEVNISHQTYGTQ